MRRFPLLLKFIIIYVLFAALSIAVIATYTYRITYHSTLETKAAELRRISQTLADESSRVFDGVSVTDAEYLEKLALISGFEDFDIMMTDTTGKVLFDSSGALTGTTITAYDPQQPGTYYSTGTWDGIFMEERLIVSSHLTAKYTVFGYLFISEPLSVIERQANDLIKPTYYTFFIVFVISLLIPVMIYFILHKPVRKITRAAREYADGNLSYELSVKTRDELGYLADTLNYMAHELDRTGEYQRQFVSNVSHDLRSPLTSIKGYLTAILDGTIPPENQEKYLNLVIRETERLQGLTQNVLQLNSVEKFSMYMEYADFDINRLIRDTCSSFEGRCREKDISFELIFEEKETAVHADRSKIQQVLYNLTDNAIKFSPEGSAITVETFRRADKVFVSVKDQGVGITKESLKKIWNRFYKADESRGQDKKGSGIGLAIVREVINAHGENIDVISTEGVGTEFIFSLSGV